MQYELSCKTAQQLRLRTCQANGWKNSHLILRHYHILLHWVFQRLQKSMLRVSALLTLTFLVLASAFVRVENHCLRLYLAGNCENHPSESHPCLSTSLSHLSFLWTTKQSALVTTIHDPVLVLHRGMLFRSF